MKEHSTIKEGDVLEGKITGIQPYGVFIKLSEDCSGLVHTTELERLESENPLRFFKIGQSVKVKVLRIKPGGQQAVLRLHRASNQKRRVGASHFETANGFSVLEQKLPQWVAQSKGKPFFHR